MQVAVIHTAFEDVPQTVAFVEVGERTGEDALEYAYRWTNNVMGSWSIKEQYLGDEANGDYNDDVTVMAPLHKDDDGREWGLRSTSVGDQMLMGTTKYRVAGVGFEEI
jgi:hypothetical protein